MQRFLIVGLGNPGPEYSHTRHNIGFDVVEAFITLQGGIFNTGKYANVASVKVKGREFICICPNTYMNLSGQAFRYWMEKENIPVEQTLTIVDDLALPLSKIRLRGSGSDAGHNGLKDIQQMLGTDKYPKLRFGIGNDFPKGRQVDFVLGSWLPGELPIVQAKIKYCCEVIVSFALAGLSYTMNMANRMEFKVEDSASQP
jgi:PTH1 family peptidyl-tRNA hydrolase